jgi:large subunit ribosomal protein L15
MNLHSLKPAKGSTKPAKRIGRGEGSGRGGTSTKGHKGAQSRSGYSRKAGFEGGQMPLYRRVPKSGFKNINRVAYTAINLSTLQYLFDVKKISVVDMETMRANGLVGKNDLVKILAKGTITAKMEVKAHAFSRKAMELIEARGGVVRRIV